MNDRWHYANTDAAPWRHVRVTVDVVACPDGPLTTDAHLLDAVLREVRDDISGMPRIKVGAAGSVFYGVAEGGHPLLPTLAAGAVSADYRVEMVDRQVNPDHNEAEAVS